MRTDNPLDQLPDAMITTSETAQARLDAIEERLKSMPPESKEYLHLSLGKARLLTDLNRKPEAWDLARDTFKTYMAHKDYEGAVDACDTLFLTGQDEPSLAALGMGIWLAVTYPVSPELTIGILQHIIDETPDDADGAAVAAATACYIADIRAPEDMREKLAFFTNQMLGNVARRHSNIQSQEQFDRWLQKMELNDPVKFLVRLRNIVDVLVQENWWFDRETLQAEIPDQ